MDATSGVDSTKLLTASTTIGLALQACYLSPVVDKIEVWKWVVRALEVARVECIARFDVENKYPHLSLVQYYLYARDSVALSHLSTASGALVTWANEQTMDQSDYSDNKMFWLIVGLIETGNIDDAKGLVVKFNPKDEKLLVAIFLGCHLAQLIRSLPKNDKVHAKEICNRLGDKIAVFKNQLFKEIGSTLLEFRNGEIKAIDDEMDTKEIQIN